MERTLYNFYAVSLFDRIYVILAAHYTTYLAFSNSDSGNTLVNVSRPRLRQGLGSVFGEYAVCGTVEFFFLYKGT